MKLLISVLTALVLFEHPILAGNEGGAGGDGVLLGNDLYLIDLVEAGIELDPYLDTAFEKDPVFNDVVKRLETPLAALKAPDVNRLLALKLIELSKISTPLALTLLQTIESYRWLLVNHALVDVKDEDSVLEIGAGKLTQLAIRRLHSISVSRQSWQQLNSAHRAALVLHEATFAIVRPQFSGKPEDKDTWGYQSSPKAREFVGLLFSRDKTHIPDLLDGIGALYGFQYNISPENYYERAKKGNEPVAEWMLRSHLSVQVEKRMDKYEGTTSEKDFDPTSETAAKDICAEALALAKRLYEGKIPRFNQQDLFTVSVYVRPRKEDHYFSDWRTFINAEHGVSVFRQWMSYGESYVYSVNAFGLSNAPWDQAKCEEAVGKRLAWYLSLSPVPNVFWKPR